jgi:hypothetical protein
VSNALKDKALSRIAWNYQSAPRRLGEGSFFGIEADTRHPVLVIGAMALETVLRQDGADFPIEVDFRIQSGSD